jgi:hypothetical protein
MSIWNRITEWFRNREDRQKMIREFNNAAKSAFITGIAPTLLQASASRGNRDYRHTFSAPVYTGFRIKVLTGQALSRSEVMFIGTVIVSDTLLVRKLVVLGFDTLEVHGDTDAYGLRWKLIDYAEMGTILIEQ